MDRSCPSFLPTTVAQTSICCEHPLGSRPHRCLTSEAPYSTPQYDQDAHSLRPWPVAHSRAPAYCTHHPISSSPHQDFAVHLLPHCRSSNIAWVAMFLSPQRMYWVASFYKAQRLRLLAALATSVWRRCGCPQPRKWGYPLSEPRPDPRFLLQHYR